MLGSTVVRGGRVPPPLLPTARGAGGSSKADKKRLEEDEHILHTLQDRTADASLSGTRGWVVGAACGRSRGATVAQSAPPAQRRGRAPSRRPSRAGGIHALATGLGMPGDGLGRDCRAGGAVGACRCW